MRKKRETKRDYVKGQETADPSQKVKKKRRKSKGLFKGIVTVTHTHTYTYIYM